MLVDNSIYKNRYIANGISTEFTIDFPFLDASHIAVYKQTGQAQEVIVNTAEYTVEGAGNEEGGKVIFNTAPPSGTVIAIIRNVPITQLYAYTELDNFPAESHENALAKLTMICQELKENSDRSIKMTVTSDKSAEQFFNETISEIESTSAIVEQTKEECLAALEEIQEANYTPLVDFEALSDTVADVSTVASGAASNVSDAMEDIAQINEDLANVSGVANGAADLANQAIAIASSAISYKGSVATAADLPVGADAGDIYLVEEDSKTYITDGYGDWAEFNAINVDQSLVTDSTNPVAGGAVKTAVDAKADDSNVVKLTGDQTVGGAKTFTSTITIGSNQSIARSVNDQEVQVCGGTNISNGGTFFVWGKDKSSTTYKGAFICRATLDGTTRYDLHGKPDGTLTWNSKDITGDTKKADIQTSVKFYGAVGNGSQDDTVSFTSAYSAVSGKPAKEIYVPSGTYLVDDANSTLKSKKVFSLCEGEGVLHYKNGAWNPMRNPGNTEALASRIISEFKFGSGAESTVQALGIIDDYVFTCQNRADNQFTIAMFQLPASETDTAVSVNLASQGGLSKVAEKTFTVSSIGSKHCGMCHPVWANASKTSATIYVIHQNIWSEVTWNMTTPANSTISSVDHSTNIYRNETRSVGCVSTDKTKLAFCGYVSSKPSNFGLTAPYWCITIYDFAAYLNKGNNVIYPEQQIHIPRTDGRITLSGMAMDNKHIYILSCTDTVYSAKTLTIISRDGSEIRDIKLSGIVSSLLSAFRFGSSNRYCYMYEAEGLAFWKDSLVFYDKFYTGTAASYCTCAGSTYVCLNSCTNKPPSDTEYWHRVDGTRSGASAWSATTAYTGLGSKVFSKFFIGIAPLGTWPAKEKPIKAHVAALDGTTVNASGPMSLDSTSREFVFGHRVQTGEFFVNALINDDGLRLYKVDQQAARNSAYVSDGSLINCRLQPDSNTQSTLWPAAGNSDNANLRIYGHTWPGTSNKYSLGLASRLWSVVYAKTGSINTSDRRQKTDIADVDEALMRAWGKVRFVVFRLKDSIREKGDAARIHVGCIAQEIMEAFESEGLDVTRYGFFCHDRWEAQPATYRKENIYDDRGKVIDVREVLDTPAQPAGDAYALRYEECLALECAYLRWRMDRLENTLFNNGEV